MGDDHNPVRRPTSYPVTTNTLFSCLCQQEFQMNVFVENMVRPAGNDWRDTFSWKWWFTVFVQLLWLTTASHGTGLMPDWCLLVLGRFCFQGACRSMNPDDRHVFHSSVTPGRWSLRVSQSDRALRYLGFLKYPRDSFTHHFIPVLSWYLCCLWQHSCYSGFLCSADIFTFSSW